MSHPIPRWFNVAALVLAPVTGLIAALAVPGLSTTTQGGLDQVAAHPERFHVYALGILLSGYLIIPAFFGLMSLVRERSPRWAYLAGGLAQIGAVIAVGDAAVEFMYWKMGVATDQAPMIALSDRYDAGTGWIYNVGGLAVTLGSIGLAVALWRTRVVPRWVAVGLAACVLVNIAGFSMASQPMLIASYVVMLGALSRAALVIVDRDEVTVPVAVPVTA
jgi:hypothetical protein